MSRRALFALLALVAAACGGGGPRPDPGAADARAAVERFLNAARAKDGPLFGAVWGTAKGSARDAMDRDELQKRQQVLFCLLAHEQSRIGAPGVAEGGRQQFPVELRSGLRTANTRVTAVPGPGGRWFVENVDVEPLRDLCRPSTPTP